ncbi:MAG: hypothetical protein LW832_08925 [Parachlamydia sp.]|jgi:hypothetical protein|nr:hypothetical protein [Parachlamydia sp.]
MQPTSIINYEYQFINFFKNVVLTDKISHSSKLFFLEKLAPFILSIEHFRNQARTQIRWQAQKIEELEDKLKLSELKCNEEANKASHFAYCYERASEESSALSIQLQLVCDSVEEKNSVIEVLAIDLIEMSQNVTNLSNQLEDSINESKNKRKREEEVEVASAPKKMKMAESNSSKLRRYRDKIAELDKFKSQIAAQNSHTGSLEQLLNLKKNSN